THHPPSDTLEGKAWWAWHIHLEKQLAPRVFLALGEDRPPDFFFVDGAKVGPGGSAFPPPISDECQRVLQKRLGEFQEKGYLRRMPDGGGIGVPPECMMNGSNGAETFQRVQVAWSAGHCDDPREDHRQPVCRQLDQLRPAAARCTR